MKKTTVSLVLSAALLAIANAGASEFDGGYVGIKAGGNNSEVTGSTAIPSANSITYGLDGGYGWDVGGIVLGLEGFLDSNKNKDHSLNYTNVGSTDFGLDVKAGIPFGSFMPYAKVGYIQVLGDNSRNINPTRGVLDNGFVSGGGAHGAVGVEYKFTKNWGLSGEWGVSAPTDRGAKFKNENLTLGLNYHFDKPKPAPVIVTREEPKPEPVVVRKEEPKPTPTPEPRWKSVVTEKPVRIDGANFAFDSAKLLPAADTRLNEVLQAAKDYPEINLEVDGHTDSIGSRAHNQKLSERRAAAVKAWLVKHGVAANRINTAGFADTKPVASNKTKEGRAANRRVEVFYLIREEKKVRVQ